jgi:hypothetical protein
VRLAAGLTLSALSSGALNWGFFQQHKAAGGVPSLSLGHPVRSLLSLFASSRWLTGFLVGIAGWGLYIAALLLAPLSLVQATSAGGIGLLALMVSRTRPGGLDPPEWRGVAVAVLGLFLLGLSLVGQVSTTGHGGWTSVTLWVGVSIGVAAVAAGPAARLLVPGAGLGLAAGVLYAAGDVATKAALGGGARLAFAPVVASCHAAAFVALQLGFQRGGALSTAGLATVLTNSLPIAAGIVLFDESVPAGLPGWLRVAAFACVVAGAGLLSRRPGRVAKAGRQMHSQRSSG